MSESAIVAHQLRLFGLPQAGDDPRTDPRPLVLDAPGSNHVDVARQFLSKKCPVVALRPDQAFLSAFDLGSTEIGSSPPVIAYVVGDEHRVRSLHRVMALRSLADDNGLAPVVRAADGQAIWGWLPMGGTGLLIIGTDLAGDLIRYRQGDPAAAENRETAERWGFAGERPNYLFEGQLLGEDPHERHADWWVWTLRDALQRHAGLEPLPVLPGGAPGAVVVTGDDDQAALSCYAKQTDALRNLPVTYFLHPLTKHDRGSLAELGRGRRVELGLHPDALDAPDQYAGRLVEQAAWFERLTGFRSRCVRNHGFLNDGYWGHLPHWRKTGITASSNLPGVDGHVINGSLLPGRVAIDGELGEHWSVLTAIGDGVIFLNDLDSEAAGAVVRENGARVRASGVPGVLVLNLHPENIDRSLGMHAAVHELVEDGFVAWTMSEMLDWFMARDRGEAVLDHPFTNDETAFATGTGSAQGARTLLDTLRHGAARLVGRA